MLNAVLLCLLRYGFPGIASKASISWSDILALLAMLGEPYHSKQSKHIGHAGEALASIANKASISDMLRKP